MTDILYPALSAGVSVFMIIIAVFSRDRNSEYAGRGNHYIWDNALEKLYDAVFGAEDPFAIGAKVGFERDRYMSACDIIDYKPNIKKEVMSRIAGMVLAAAAGIAGALTANVLLLATAFVCYYMMVLYKAGKLYSDAEKKKKRLERDLPRYSDLLYMALRTDMPIELAISTTAQCFPCELASELSATVTVMAMGADSWEGALEKMARKYEIDILSDFISDIVNASRKGISITETVGRKTKEIKKAGLLKAKETAAKAENGIMLPVTIFKMLPLMFLLILPMIMQLFGFTL